MKRELKRMAAGIRELESQHLMEVRAEARETLLGGRDVNEWEAEMRTGVEQDAIRYMDGEPR